MTFLNLSRDEQIYASLLAVSVPLGYAIRKQTNPRVKQYLSSGFGFTMVVLVCGVHTLHSLFTALVNCLIVICFKPR